MVQIVFMGTPDFSIPVLRALIEKHTVLGVITQPDRPAGRSRTPQPAPVKRLAEQHHIPVFQPEKIRRPEAIEILKQWQPDVYVVAAFGQILPQTVLDLPPHGSINVHASLLPRWRGAAPIQAAIRAGDTETGITIMKMDAGLDTGPILTQRAIPIEPGETGQSLHDKLAELGAELLLDTLPGYLDGSVQPRPQDDADMTYAPMIKKAEGMIDWVQDANAIERLIRAFTPWPGTSTMWEGQPLKILAATADVGSANAGEVVDREGRIAIGTGSGLLYPTLVQLAGRSVLTVEEFLRGHPNFLNSVLGS